MKSRYVRQWIVCLSKDLHNTGLALAQKKDAAPTVGGVRLLDKGPGQGPFEHVGDAGLARLIVVGHGGEARGLWGSQIGEGLTPETLATFINGWLGGNKIERISLHMCWGAGTAEVFVKGGGGVAPQESFAFKLARYCGQLANSVTARPGKVNVYWGGPTFTGTGANRKPTGLVEHDTENQMYGHRRIAYAVKPVTKDYQPIMDSDVWVFQPNEKSTLAAPLDPTYKKKSEFGDG